MEVSKMTKLKYIKPLLVLAALASSEFIKTGVADAIDPAELSASAAAPIGGPVKVPGKSGIPREQLDSLKQLFMMTKDGKLLRESRIDLNMLGDLNLAGDAEYWRPYERYFEATIVNNSVEITCAQQGAAHLIRNFSPDTLDAYGTEAGQPFNDPAAPYHDANADFRTLSQDVPFVFIHLRSGLAIQCQLRRDDSGKPFALFMLRFVRTIANGQLVTINAREAGQFFKTFGAFVKIACGAQAKGGKGGKFYYVWAQRKQSEFTRDILVRTFNLLLQEDKKNKAFSEPEQLELGIHPTQKYDGAYKAWGNSFMDGYTNTDAAKFIYNDRPVLKRK
jgi:hypothetical protein